MFNCLLLYRVLLTRDYGTAGHETTIRPTTAGVCHISCQSGKWQGFVSRGDKVTQKGLIFALEFDKYVQHQRRAED